MVIEKRNNVLWGSILILMLIFFISLLIGRYHIAPLDFFRIIFTTLRGSVSGEASDWRVFYYIRLPRVILVTGVGAVLAMTGATYQSIFRNPLVSPDILGVAAGASFGVALGILISPDSFYIIYILAFLSGILAVFLTYGISLLARGQDVMMMVLAGIIVGSLFNALLSILKYLADPYEKLPGIVFWLMGGFSRTGWGEVKFTLPFMITGFIVLYIMRWYLNVMSLGEEEAVSLGLNVNMFRLVLILFSTMMVAVSVATSGQVTWIGLVVPHIARYLVGSDHKIMLPVAGLLGSSLLLIMDNLARMLTSAEIPISIITAFIGAPFFAYLLITRRESGWQ